MNPRAVIPIAILKLESGAPKRGPNMGIISVKYVIRNKCQDLELVVFEIRIETIAGIIKTNTNSPSSKLPSIDKTRVAKNASKPVLDPAIPPTIQILSALILGIPLSARIIINLPVYASRTTWMRKGCIRAVFLKNLAGL